MKTLNEKDARRERKVKLLETRLDLILQKGRAALACGDTRAALYFSHRAKLVSSLLAEARTVEFDFA